MAEPSGTISRWKVHSEAYPAASALAAKVARFSGVAQYAGHRGAESDLHSPHPRVCREQNTSRARTENQPMAY